MMMRLKRGLSAMGVITALSLGFLASLAQAAEKTDEPPGCDTSKNHETWYISHRECGPQGTQISLLATISKHEVHGSQVSLLANVSSENVDQDQIAGTLNMAPRVHSQLLANVNIANHVSGMQLGGVNIADTARTQFGSLNIAHHLDRFGIGLLTLADNALLHVDASVEETGMENLSFASGRGFLTSYSVGYTVGDAGHPYAFGMGFGYHQDIARLYSEVELHGSLVLDRYSQLKDFGKEHHQPGDEEWRNNLLFQGKLRLGGPVFRGLGVFGGISYNVLVFPGNERLAHSWSEDLTGSSKDIAWWPGLEAGIRLGR